uniref:Dual specificity protein phosphatase 12 n=1 Tax=Sphenodon punctatus TaxID=8508 RepID=A0A8D0GN42_SPHPU
MAQAGSAEGSSMVQVLPGLYLGGWAEAGSALGPLVGSVLMVDTEEPEPAELGKRILHIPALDQPDTDLLSRLDECAAFLSAARRDGGGLAALVRCHAGVSRSVAVVTAYLMKTNNLTFEEAYAAVKAAKPDAKMNEGFEWQLKLYEAMGCKVDTTSAVYKQYRLQKVTEKFPELHSMPREVFAVDPTTVSQTLNSEALYRCRKCRRSLYRSSSILSHAEGNGPAAFARKRIPEPALLHADGQAKCTSYFIEPVQWMEPVLLGVMEGQLLCPKCTSKLGSFSWRGEQCSCGRWVTPAFQIHKSRVDEVQALPIYGRQTFKI